MKLDHENVIKCKRCFIENNDLYTVLEYARCGDLRSFIAFFCNRSSLIPECVIRILLLECLRGLQYIHSQGIIHRDIKPQNILLAEKGVVKICDFGIARERSAASAPQTCAGTFQYMAPEVVNGEEYDESADVWSLGCVFYELCWRRPLVASNPYSEISTSVDTVDTSHLSFPAIYSSQLCSILSSMLQRERAKRSSVERILSTLEDMNCESGIRLLQSYAEQWFFETQLKTAIPKPFACRRADAGKVACKLQYNAEYMHRNMEALTRVYNAVVTNSTKEWVVSYINDKEYNTANKRAKDTTNITLSPPLQTSSPDSPALEPSFEFPALEPSFEFPALEPSFEPPVLEPSRSSPASKPSPGPPLTSSHHCPRWAAVRPHTE